LYDRQVAPPDGIGDIGMCERSVFWKIRPVHVNPTVTESALPYEF
jgi:hypothetical protein